MKGKARRKHLRRRGLVVLCVILAFCAVAGVTGYGRSMARRWVGCDPVPDE